jgi:hypothetical protein
VLFYRSRSKRHYVSFSAPEETLEEEEDPDYQEEFEEDALPGATSHPTS